MNLQKKLKKVISIIFFLFFISINIVYAQTSTDLRLCEYPGVIRTLKLIGLFIFIAKILVPILLIGFSIVDVSKTIISGKADDLKKAAMTILKRAIAGLLIFFIPTIVNYCFQTLVEAVDASEYQACSTCLLDFNNCEIPEEDQIVIDDFENES